MDNLSFLTVEQTLADLISFITQVRQHLQVPPFARVYVWGKGVGGTLATWARQKYPFAIHASWSSGGIFEPSVFATENYNWLASNIEEYGGRACSDRVRAAFQAIQQQLIAGDDTLLVEQFSICRPWNISNHMDVGLMSEGTIAQIADFFNSNQ